MPIKYRRWFLNRLIKDMKKINEASKPENTFGDDANHSNSQNLEKYQEFLNKKFK